MFSFHFQKVKKVEGFKNVLCHAKVALTYYFSELLKSLSVSFSKHDDEREKLLFAMKMLAKLELEIVVFQNCHQLQLVYPKKNGFLFSTQTQLLHKLFNVSQERKSIQTQELVPHPYPSHSFNSEALSLLIWTIARKGIP
jgi:hypothetical protein